MLKYLLLITMMMYLISTVSAECDNTFDESNLGTTCTENELNHDVKTCVSSNIINITSVRLLSSDHEEFVVSKEIAKQSVFIKSILLDGETETAIPLPNVTAKVLQKVIEWCDHHSSDPIPTTEEEEETDQRVTEIDAWDQNFLDVDQETLFDIILAAYYLDIKGLVDVGAKTVANMIKGKTAKEIQTIFNISSDFTREEEAQIRKENEWTEDR